MSDSTSTTIIERQRALDFADANFEDAVKAQSRAVETLAKKDALVEACENAWRVAEDALQANLFDDEEEWDPKDPRIEEHVYIVVCAGKVSDGKRCNEVLKIGHDEVMVERDEWDHVDLRWRPEGFKKRWRCRKCGGWEVPEVCNVGKRF